MIMRAIQHVHQKKIKEARLEIVAQMYKRGSTIRAIRAEVMRRLDLKTYSTQTVHKDVQTLLKEWRESRLSDMDDALQLELARIDDTVRELWEQWEKSKEDYTKTQRKRKGAPARSGNQDNNNGDDGGIRTFSVEEQTEQVVRLGNPTYIAEIRQQLAERRKLLGLYAPEKRDIKGEVSVSRPPSEMTVEEIEKELETLKLTE
jgi:hypothetical protein|nr:MAG TPA: hypothetical protein [Caudoviricetes sp.]